MDKKEKELLFDDPVQWFKSKVLDKTRFVEDENNWFREKLIDLQYEHQDRLVEIHNLFANQLHEARDLLILAGINWDDVIEEAQKNNV